MAKKKSKGRFEFSKIGKIVSGISEKTGILVEDSSNVIEKEFIGTGIYVLNALFSKSILNGGIQNNRITAIAGPSGVGKSFLCYNICREAQKDGYSIIYIDTEFSIELEDMENYGIDIDPEKLQLVRSNSVEDLKIMLTQLLGQLKEEKLAGYDIDKFLIVIDSAGQLASRKEIEDAKAGKEKADMTRAKAMKSLFRIVNSDLGFLKVPMLVTNHTYLSMDLFPRPIMSGGTGLIYSASTIIMLSKAKYKTGEEDADLGIGQSGVLVTAKADKNRLAKPAKIKFTIDFTKGCNPYDYLEFFCTPENFEKVGIAKGKMEVDKETGEMTFKPGGTRWYIRHLNKSVFSKQLNTPQVFTEEVLLALEPLIYKHFEYSSLDEMQETEEEFIKSQTDEYSDVDIDDVDGTELFS
ncbi:MAG: UvsX [uncultured marine phage]|uniref:UvsX n=1 Tax=uncultured marine phage TaxID=707152 RepID=A0A8D9CCU7_9VIRU|nr:MAG: UvsX [uncultured marine phage]